jgi:hypothetical protein
VRKRGIGGRTKNCHNRRDCQRSQIGIQALTAQQSAFSQSKKQKKRPEMRYRRGMYDFAGKSFRSRLRDFGCPDTLIKDVRDVAAAVMCSEGPGRTKRSSIDRESRPSKA